MVSGPKWRSSSITRPSGASVQTTVAAVECNRPLTKPTRSRLGCPALANGMAALRLLYFVGGSR